MTYHSLQTTAKVRQWHGLTEQFSYTWGHTMETNASFSRPQNSFDIRGDYGNGMYDMRHSFTGLIDYQLPKPRRGPSVLLGGWQLSSLISLHTGMPFNITNEVDTTGTGEGAMRPDLVGDPYAGVNRSFSKDGVQLVNPAAFALPGRGQVRQSALQLLLRAGLRRGRSLHHEADPDHRAGQQPAPLRALQHVAAGEPGGSLRGLRGTQGEQRLRDLERHHRRRERRPWNRPGRAVQTCKSP